MRQPARRRRCLRQNGMTLIELLVGITIGLLVIGAAIGTLVLSRQTAGTVSEISQLQQQASFAMRVLGAQLRQAGALELVPLSAGGPLTFNGLNDLTGPVLPLQGNDGASGAPDTLTVRNQPSALPSLQRDCANGVLATVPVDSSAFSVNSSSNSLTCLSATNILAQPVAANVADFQVNYRVNVGSTAAPSFQILSASALTPAQWEGVSAIELCLDLRGIEPIPDLGTTYLNCQGTAVSRGSRNHFVSRNVFHVRRLNVF